MFNKVTSIVCDRWGNVCWKLKLEQVKKYIDKNKEKPSQHDKNKNIKILGSWIQTQQKNYSKKIQIMQNEEIRTIWEEFIKEYRKYFKTNEESWNDILKQVKEYIDENKENPLTTNKNRNIKMLGSWIRTQRKNYAKKVQIMQNEEIRTIWEEFIKEYGKYFKSNEESWNDILKQVKEYIDKNKKCPSSTDKNKNIKLLGNWLSHQQTNYSKRTYIMQNKEIIAIWEEFMKEYSKYFKTNDESWNDILKQVKEYIDENKEKPSQYDKNENIRMLGQWIQTQQKNYPKKVKIMKNEEIRTIWEEFIKGYRKYFKTNEERWNDTSKQVIEYIDENKEKPSQYDKNVNIKMLGRWLQHQRTNYRKKIDIMKNKEIRTTWEEFIKEYSHYFKTNKKLKF
jgi:antitoxin component HigA of HigAB toxin-antitoxin module